MANLSDTELEILERSRAYKGVFGGPAGSKVLLDLAIFCRANATAFDPDPRVHAVLEGRREVWLRIQDYLGLSFDDLIALKTRRTVIVQSPPNEDTQT